MSWQPCTFAAQVPVLCLIYLCQIGTSEWLSSDMQDWHVQDCCWSSRSGSVDGVVVVLQAEIAAHEAFVVKLEAEADTKIAAWQQETAQLRAVAWLL